MTIGEDTELRYGQPYVPGKYMLLTVPTELEEMFIQAADPTQDTMLFLRGGEEEEAALCTQDATYAVNLNDTSNALMLFREGRPEGMDDTPGLKALEAVDTCDSILELRRIPPRLDRLACLFASSLYPSASEEGGGAALQDKSLGFTWEEILSVMAASEKELVESMREMHIIELNGQWRRLKMEYVEESLKFLLSCIPLHGRTLDHVSYTRCKQDLCDESDYLPVQVLQHLLRYMGRPKHDHPDHEDFKGPTWRGIEEWSLDETRVCTFLAHRLMQSHPGKKWRREELLVAWKDVCPHPFQPTLTMLKSCIVEVESPESLTQCLLYLDVETLPRQPAARFKELFSLKDRWILSDMAPFIRPLTTKEAELDRLIRTWGRVVRSGESTWVVSRIPS